MTFEELLKACGSGKLPKVKTSKPFSHKNAEGGFSRPEIGVVVTIKNTDRHKGCAVYYEGLNWYPWYRADNGNDYRSQYMRDLTIIEE